MRELAQQVGIFLLVLLMIYVFYNDINRLIFSLKRDIYAIIDLKLH